MSGIAEVLLNLGYRVSGSDLSETEITHHLKQLGAKIYQGHSASHVKKCDVVVYSSAVSKQNPEILKAHELAIPVIPRAEMLAELMRMKYGVAVAGAHGKTTTTSILGSLLSHGGLDPTVVIGGRLNRWGTNAKLGQGKYMVVEADESDGSFHLLTPTVAIVTNIDNDHLDYYKTVDAIKEAFVTFLNKLPFYGLAVVCGDDLHLKSILPKLKKKVVTYGIGPHCRYQAKHIRFNGFESAFDVYEDRRKIGSFKIKAPGVHNVKNALSCIVVAQFLGMKPRAIQQGLLKYTGVQRRFHIRGEVGNILVMDDYGHHPTEIKATLAATKKIWPRRRLLVVFQPHRYTRTRDCFYDFLSAFRKADVLVLTEIYPAGENPIRGISGERVYQQIRKRQKNVHFSSDKKTLVSDMEKLVKSGDVILTLGAGDIWKYGEELLGVLKSNER